MDGVVFMYVVWLGNTNKQIPCWRLVDGVVFMYVVWLGNTYKHTLLEVGGWCCIYVCGVVR